MTAVVVVAVVTEIPAGQAMRRGGGSQTASKRFIHALHLPQVEGEVTASVPGQAGGDGDQVAAQRGATSLGMAGTGQAACGAQQIEGDRRAGHPGGVRGEVP
ncbi:hypothetical protein GCM10009555_078590 [Acrocarpospora macrocephala]|uniref:Uncharacterized protein n=1 Tax=Acrocarpospora macrocephala TaxID=150177 RepID=A0A5M3X5A7_9ACTN|nr:hypothetical protein Amac_098580 [Acrocarpospora macrocephala]